MSRTFETTVEINGAIGSSFTSAFRSARSGMTDLRQEARAVQRELDRLGTDFRNGRIHQSQYTEETRRLTAELDNLESRQQRFNMFKNAVSNGWNTTKAVASVAAIGAATAAVATTFDAINVASDFEAQLSKVQAKTQGTNQEMSALRQTALELGASTSLSASETALAMDGLAAGGMNVNNIIAAMPGIIAGAEASGEDLTLVSDTVSTALSIWSMKAEEASKVSDVLAMAANVSSASVQDMGYAFKYAGKPAADLGISLEETSAAIALMTNEGLDGSNAGTALRSSLLKLNGPGKEQQKVMDKLGFSMLDSNKEAKSLSQIIGELSKATESMTDAERVATLQTLVGTEAVSGFLTLVGAGPKKLDEMTQALENSAGAAAEASKIMMDNYAGAKEQMLGAAESAKIAFATPLLPVLQDTMNGISSLVENNMDKIEGMGNAVAQVFSNITAPIAMTKPVKPIIEPHMDPDYMQQAMSQYAKDVEKYELFQGMDAGEKISYMLEETAEAIENWLGGSGGEVMGSVFKELGTIAGKAWLTAFTTSAKGAVTELMDGNFAGALAMGASANALTGGLLLSGGLAAGKWAVNKGRNIASNRNAQNSGGNAVSATSTANSNASTVIPPTATANGSTQNTTAVTPAQNRSLRAQRSSFSTPSTTAANGTYRFNRPNAAAPVPSNTTAPSTSGRILSGVGRVASRAALPIAAVTSIASIAAADNKAEATGGAVGGIAGGLGGAKLGAAIGTAIAPGIGTAIGGALGGLAGSIGGSLFGSKAGNAIASNPTANNAVAQKPAPISDATSTNASALNQTLVTLNTNVTALSSYFGTATTATQTTFTELQNQTTLLNTNLSLLASYVGQASGWISSLQGIQPAAQRVISSLQALEQRINTIELPNGATSRRVAYE